MTTRLELRQMVRRRLGDTGVGPLWDETFLNDAIDEGLRRYSRNCQRQVSTAIAVTIGDRQITVPPDVNAMRVIRLFDDTGELWKLWNEGPLPPAPSGPPTNQHSWRAWADVIYLDTPVPRSGLWHLEHLVNRISPTDDATPMDFQVGDDDLMIALAVAIALNRRAINDGKRYTGKSGVHPLAAAARNAQNDVDRLMGNRLRVMRST